MPLVWHYDPDSRIFASGAHGRVSAEEIHRLIDAVEPLAVAGNIVAHVHMSADASPDLLKLPELTSVAKRIDALVPRIATPWFPNAIITPSPVQYGVTRMVLGLIGGDAPVEVFRDLAAGAAYAKVEPALAQRVLDLAFQEG